MESLSLDNLSGKRCKIYSLSFRIGYAESVLGSSPMPASGFGGFSQRTGLKPTIAAVNSNMLRWRL